ncbi:MAG: histone deacetylase [Myxococcota bacterium]
MSPETPRLLARLARLRHPTRLGPLRRLRHRLRRILNPSDVVLIHDTSYVRTIPGVPMDPARGQNVLAFLRSERLIPARHVLPARPATMAQLLRVHRDTWLERLQVDPTALVDVLGFQPGAVEVEGIKEVQRRMTGGTVTALQQVAFLRRTAVHLGGGLHHATAERGAGFCVFNDVAVGIAQLRASGYSGRVMVIDCDLHDGEGTRVIFARDPTVHTFSVHNTTRDLSPAVEATVLELGAGVDDRAYLQVLRERLPSLLRRFRPALCVYLAGTDPAHDDAIGNWKITAAGMLERDLFVLEQVREVGARLAVVLGGGYGPQAWRYTARFLTQLLGGEPVEPPPSDEMTLLRFRHVAATLTHDELSRRLGEDDWGITEEDIFGAWGHARRNRFLDFYTQDGLELALERYGFMDRLRALGFREPTLRLDLDGEVGHTLRIYSGPDERELLVELRVQRDKHTVPGMELLAVEWLLLQNPRRGLGGGAPLPGQKHPGLGLSQEVVGLLLMACERLGLDGILYTPAHYHVAALSRRYLRYLHPSDEARFRAVERAGRGMKLAEVSWALNQGAVVDERTGHPVRMISEPMVLPLSDRLRHQVTSAAYEDEVERLERELHFSLRNAQPAS